MSGHALDCALQWRHNGYDSVSNHQPRDCLLNRLFRRRPKKTSKLRVTGFCAGNSPGTGDFPAQMASNAENYPFDHAIMVWHFTACLVQEHVSLRHRAVKNKLIFISRYHLARKRKMIKIISWMSHQARRCLIVSRNAKCTINRYRQNTFVGVSTYTTICIFSPYFLP